MGVKGGLPDPLATYQFRGQEIIGRQLYLSWVRRCPEGVNKMLFENHPDFRPAPPPPRKKRRGDMPEWPIST